MCLAAHMFSTVSTMSIAQQPVGSLTLATKNPSGVLLESSWRPPVDLLRQRDDRVPAVIIVVALTSRAYPFSSLS